MKKKRTILLIPSRGSSIKEFRVRLSVVVMLLVLVLAGFAGYFIPFRSLTFNVVEQNQKKNLAEQNKALFQNIVSTIKLLNSLREQVVRLDSEKEQIKEIAGLPVESTESVGKRGKIDPSGMELGTLVLYIAERENFIQSFLSQISENDNVFEQTPVCYPVPYGTIITRRYGTARDPFTGKQKMHYGTDFAGEIGTPVFATASGTVSLVENDPIWGRRIIINHQFDFKTIYAHLGEVKVARGRRVKRGDVIGTIGLSGLTTGPHVHYEIWKESRPVDPEDYFFPVNDFSPIKTTALATELKKQR